MPRTFDLGALQVWLRDYDLVLSQAQLDQARTYLDTLLLWNRKMNLVSQTRPDEIITKHLADSYVTASLLQNDERIADLGSGGGFPGIPVAIAHPQASVFLVEANQRKASFLVEVAALCGLRRVSVNAERIEVFCRRSDIAHGFAAVTARALSKLDELMIAAAELLVPGGRLLAMKGPSYADELAAVSQTRFRLENVVQYELPDKARRCILDLRFT